MSASTIFVSHLAIADFLILLHLPITIGKLKKSNLSTKIEFRQTTWLRSFFVTKNILFLRKLYKGYSHARYNFPTLSSCYWSVHIHRVERFQPGQLQAKVPCHHRWFVNHIKLNLAIFSNHMACLNMHILTKPNLDWLRWNRRSV